MNSFLKKETSAWRPRVGGSTPGGGHSTGGEEQGLPGTQWSTGRACRGHGECGNVKGGGPQQEGKAVPPEEEGFTGMCALGRSLPRLQSRVMAR